MRRILFSHICYFLRGEEKAAIWKKKKSPLVSNFNSLYINAKVHFKKIYLFFCAQTGFTSGKGGVDCIHCSNFNLFTIFFFKGQQSGQVNFSFIICFFRCWAPQGQLFFTVMFPQFSSLSYHVNSSMIFYTINCMHAHQARSLGRHHLLAKSHLK